MSTTEQDFDTQTNQAVTLDQWVEAATHFPLLPSGIRVGIKVPDLADMIEAGEIPQHLLETALGLAANEDAKPTVEMIVKQKEFTNLIVKATVIEPELSDATVRKVPVEDKEMLVAFATRTRDVDAIGDHLAGLEKSEKFRKFRGLGEFDKDVEGL